MTTNCTASNAYSDSYKPGTKIACPECGREVGVRKSGKGGKHNPHAAAAKPAATSKPAKAAKPVATAKADRSYMVKPQYRAKYEVVKNDDGSRTLDNGDPIATALRGMTLDGIRAVAATVLGRSQRVLRDEYEHLNPGQQSMTLRNLIRKAYRADGGDKSFQQAVKEVA